MPNPRKPVNILKLIADAITRKHDAEDKPMWDALRAERQEINKRDRGTRGIRRGDKP